MKIEGFRKSERIVSQKQIDELFLGSSSHTKAAFPIRAIYTIKERAQDRAPVQLLLSVPKRRFKHAVDRNRIKRQLREAFRHNKRLLIEHMPADKAVDIAFVWLSSNHLSTKMVEERVSSLLKQIAQKL